MNWRLAAVGCLAVVATVGAAADSWVLTGDLNSHDPALWRESGTWWIGRTWGAGVGMAYSADGHGWNGGVPLWSTGLAWWHPFNGNSAWTWAPSLVDYNGRALCYYAVSTFGSQVSAIGLSTASSIAQGDWTDRGAPILSSKAGDPYNAIDPCFATDAAHLPWLSFGSFWGGIYLTALDPATLQPTGPVTNLAWNSAGIENSQIVYRAGYYTLFASVGSCCDGAASTYHIIYGRALSIAGPYYDRNGADLRSGGGTTLDAGGGRFITAGGETIYNNAGNWVCARHELDSQNGYATVLFINDLYWDASGWPTFQLPAPILRGQPLAATVVAGETAAFSCPADYASSYQWYKNGAAIAGGTGATLLLPAIAPTDAGSYSCVVTNAAGSTTSSPAALAVAASGEPGRLVNVSCRGGAGTGAAALIAGFYLGGAGTSGVEPVLVRASGPALSAFGIGGILPDPSLQLIATADQSTVGADAGWAGKPEIAQAAAMVGAFAWPDARSADSALVGSLAGGGYTAVVTGASGDSGVALAEVYDATAGGQRTTATPRPINLSARVAVPAGATAAIGISLAGSAARTLLVRASGPALAAFGVPGVLPDTTLAVWNVSGGNQTLLASASGWTGDAAIAAAASAAGAFSWGTAASADTAILLTLPPGQYTAEVGGLNDEPGIVLLEIYEIL